MTQLRQLLFRGNKGLHLVFLVFAVVSIIFLIQQTSTPKKLAADAPPLYKVILLWTPWFGDKSWSELIDLNSGPFMPADDLPGRHCMLSPNRSLLSKADAVIFHARDFEFIDVPTDKQRLPNQRWVFLSMEPPPMTFVEEAWLEITRSGIVFNWTASYSSKADVFFPYGRLVPTSKILTDRRDIQSGKIIEFVNNFASRKRDAIWIASHCETDSKREKLVKLLEESGMTIDSFGKCSGEDAPLWNSSNNFFSNYRYYLSFENSLCDDYVTEKLFRALKLSQNFGVIPVAYHGAKISYEKFGVPEEAFVNVNQYLPDNITQMAKFLTKTLPQDMARLSSYFKWQQDREFSLATFVRSWQQMCRKLWESENDASTTVDDVRATFGTCSPSVL